MAQKDTTIILLEDDATFRGLLAEGLRDQDFQVVEAANVEAASHAIQSVDGHAVLVADRALNGQPYTGFEAAEEALAAYPALKAVYTSGTHQALRARQLSDRERTLPKPFALSQLVSAVKHLVVRS